MTVAHRYACRDYPGMDACPGEFAAGTEGELWKMIELHASEAHGEDPASWSEEDRAYLATLIRRDAEEPQASARR
jgi:hypothetical protein